MGMSLSHSRLNLAPTFDEFFLSSSASYRATAEANLLDGMQRGKERVSFPELGNDCCRDRQPVIAIGRRIDCSQGAFKESGWSVQTKSSDTAPMDGLILRAPNDAAIAVAKALKDAGVKFEASKPTGTIRDFISKKAN